MFTSYKRYRESFEHATTENSNLTRVDRFLKASEFEWFDKVKNSITHCIESDSSCLDLSDLAITDDNIINSIVPFLNRSPQIKELIISRGDFTNEGIIYLTQNCTLEKIDCHYNNIDSDAIIALAQNKYLVSLNISQTSFCIGSEKRIAALKSLAANTVLKELIIIHEFTSSEAAIDDEGAKILATNKNLEKLNVIGNNITYKGLSILEKNKKLKIIFDKEGYFDLPDEIHKKRK